MTRDALVDTAVETLIRAAENGGGWLMFARIAVMRALDADANSDG